MKLATPEALSLTVPVICPVVDASVNPAGRAPLTRAKVIAPTPCCVTSVWL